jgi:hypothetical protein
VDRYLEQLDDDPEVAGIASHVTAEVVISALRTRLLPDYELSLERDPQLPRVRLVMSDRVLTILARHDGLMICPGEVSAPESGSYFIPLGDPRVDNDPVIYPPLEEALAAGLREFGVELSGGDTAPVAPDLVI